MTLQERIDVLDRVGQKIIVNLDQLETLFFKSKIRKRLVWQEFGQKIIRKYCPSIPGWSEIDKLGGPYENRQIS